MPHLGHPAECGAVHNRFRHTGHAHRAARKVANATAPGLSSILRRARAASSPATQRISQFQNRITPHLPAIMASTSATSSPTCPPPWVYLASKTAA